RAPPLPTPFPYTTLFRSVMAGERARPCDRASGCAPRVRGGAGPSAQSVRPRLHEAPPPLGPDRVRGHVRELVQRLGQRGADAVEDRKSTRLTPSHVKISY